MELTDDQRKILETLASMSGPALLRARGFTTWTLEDGTMWPAVRVKELEAEGLLDFSSAGNPAEPYIWAEVTDMGRAALQKTTEPTTQAPAQHLPRRGDAVERWLERQWNRADAGPGWLRVLNDLLEEYRQHADAGVALDADLEV